MPSVTVNCSFIIGIMGAIMDSQMQGIGAGAVVGVCVVVDVFSCSGVVVAMPCVTLAGGFGIGIVGTVMNSKMQGVGAWAVVGVGVVVGVIP